MPVEAHGAAIAQHLDASLADHLAQLALGHPVMLGNLGQGQRRVAGGKIKSCGGSHHLKALLNRDIFCPARKGLTGRYAATSCATSGAEARARSRK